MSMSLMGPNRGGERRAKAALALIAVLALMLIAAGVRGIVVFDTSGFDDASGFSHIYQAGRQVSLAAAHQEAPLSEVSTQSLHPLLDQTLSDQWRALRFSGEMPADFARADAARRSDMLSSLLQENAEAQDAALANALRLATAQIAPGGESAYEALILDAAALLPQEQGNMLREKLNQAKEHYSVQAANDALEHGRALLDEAMAERRLSRYANGGADLVAVTQALVRLLAEQSPQEDWVPLVAILREVPRDAAVYAVQLSLPQDQPFTAVLPTLEAQNIAGAKLIALNRALYERVRTTAEEALDAHQGELLDMLVQSLEGENAESLRNRAAMLQAQAWNTQLVPLLQEASELLRAHAQAGPMPDTLSALAQGNDPQKLENDLATRLMAQRDAATDKQIAAYLMDLPAGSALTTKARLLSAFNALAQQAVPAAKLTGEQQEQLLSALTSPEGTLPDDLAAQLEPKAGHSQKLSWLLQSAGYSAPIEEQTAMGLRLAVRQNAPRVRAALTIAQGGGGFVQQLMDSQGKVLTLAGALLLIDALMLLLFMRQSQEWRLDVKWLLVLLIVDFMLVFQVLPLLFLLARALTPDGSLSLVTFGRLFSYNMNRNALFNTIVAGLAAMALGTLLAFPLAWLVGRTNLHGKKLFRGLFVLTYMVPPYVGAMAWLRLLNPNVGSINQFLRGVFQLGSAAGPINIYSLGGLIWVLTTFYYPYAFITISRAMEKMDPSLEEASRISGASPFITLMKVTLPIMTPSLIAGALLVFVSAASCYGIPSIIGAPGRVHTVTTRIIEYYGRGTQGLNDATGLAVFLMVLAILILYLSDFVVAKKQYITVTGKSTRPNIVDLRSWRVPLTVLVSLFAMFMIILPFVTILTTSLKIDVGKSLLDAGNFTFSQWTTIFSRSETMDSLKNSLIFAAVAASIGIVVAITMSYLMQRTRIRGRKLPDFLIILGSGSPSVVIALGLIMTMQGRFGVNIYNTAYIIIVAYLIKYMMMGMRTVTSAISQIHVSLEESSQVSGAPWLTTMRRVTGPLIFPSIAAGWFLIFIPCFYELSMTTLLYSNTTKTIGFQLYEYWTYTSQPQASAMAFGILLIVILINQLLSRLTRGEFTI